MFKYPECPSTPNSPISPDQKEQQRFLFNDQQINSSIHSVFRKAGFHDALKISNSLQGSVWRATRVTPNGLTKSFVIKVANQLLYTQSQGIVNGKTYAVKEDIVLEQSILKYLTQDNSCPKSIVKWHEFFKSDTDLFLVMEDAGSTLFDFVQKAHNLLKLKKISFRHWHKVCQVILRQMMECIEFIHSKHVAHFDISLENWLINDVEIDVAKVKGKERVTFVLDDLQVKLCDFGLAKIFTNKCFLSNKHCGKEGYKSPEINAKKRGFNANSNDLWCIGICMFMLCTGIAPWTKAQMTDKNYAFIRKYGMKDALKVWGVARYIDRNMQLLIDAMLHREDDRVNMKQIKLYLSAWFN